MSNEQLDRVIEDVRGTLSSWGPETTIDEMRKGWDDLFGSVEPTVGATSEAVDAGGVPAEWISAPEASVDRTILFLHGGGYILGSIHSHRDLCERLSRAAQARVLAVDYRLAPEHPFPAAVEDAQTAYQWLLDQGVKPDQLAIAGDSAGGGLALATLLAAKQHDQPMPACAALLSPFVDLEGTGESMASPDIDDPLIQPQMVQMTTMAYLQTGDAQNPLAAPLHGDLAGLPPLLIHVGGRERLLDDARRIADHAQTAGVPVQLEVWDGQIHVFQIFASRLDEGEEAIQKVGKFIRDHTV